WAWALGWPTFGGPSGASHRGQTQETKVADHQRIDSALHVRDSRATCVARLVWKLFPRLADRDDRSAPEHPTTATAKGVADQTRSPPPVPAEQAGNPVAETRLTTACLWRGSHHGSRCSS